MTIRRPRDGSAGDRRIADRRHVPALTGIRGYAACWVVVFHASFVAALIQPALPSQDAWPLIRRGYLAVDLFFILSGYVLMLTHGEAIAQRGVRALRPFAVGRLFRVLPLHWAVLASLVLLTAVLPRERWIGIAPDPHLLVQNIALVQGWLGDPLSWNTPAWSLSAEWLAYAVFPAVAVAIGRTGPWGCVAVIAAGSGGLALASGWRGDTGLNHVHALGLLRCCCEFPIGMAGCRLQRLGWPDGPGEADRLLAGGLGFVALAMVSRRLEGGAAVLGFLGIVMASGAGSPLARRLFGGAVAIHLGEISFSLYLIHFALLDMAWAAMARWVPPSGPWVAATVLGACLLVVPAAHLAWRGIERPGQALGRRLQRRRPN